VQSIEVDHSWSFREASRADTSYLTHGYHRYPAKFIPQLAARVIRENTVAGDLVCDPFMGSGTTLVEAIVNGRRAYGTDINPAAVMISKAKTAPINPAKLQSEVDSVFDYLQAAKHKENYAQVDYSALGITEPSRERINYWFSEKQQRDLALILQRIRLVQDQAIQNFLLCSFSNILKGCSIWMLKSVKPTRDWQKKVAPAWRSFMLQTEKMTRKNAEFWQVMQGICVGAGVGAKPEPECIVDSRDARHLALRDSSVDLILTSPPYVTSYEYADLHQLTALWLGYTDSLKDFRSRFIGSIQKQDIECKLYNKLAADTVSRLKAKDKKEGSAAERYFFEMQQCFDEMYRVLKLGGKAAIIIGDTDLKKVQIKNAEVFVQTMEKIGFRTCNIIKRPVPSKILPLTRDLRTGRFAKVASSDRLAYPTEYIVMMEKA
jgi:DNA modification methylase